MHRALDLLLNVVEHAGGRVSNGEAKVVDQTAGVLAVPTVCRLPGAIYVLAQPPHEGPVIRVLCRQLDVRGFTGSVAAQKWARLMSMKDTWIRSGLLGS